MPHSPSAALSSRPQPSLTSSPSSLSISTAGSSSSSGHQPTPPGSPHQARRPSELAPSSLSSSSSPSSLSLSVFERRDDSGRAELSKGSHRGAVIVGGELIRQGQPAQGALQLGDDDAAADEAEVETPDKPPTFKERMAKMQAFARGREGVVFLKGGMAVAQIVALSVVLILSHSTPSPTSPAVPQSSACPARYPLQAWLIVHIVRVAICWPTSCWLLLRRLKAEKAAGSAETGGEEDVETSGDSRWGRSRSLSGSSGSSDRTRAPSTSTGPPLSSSPAEEIDPATVTSLARILDMVAPKISLLCLLTNLVSFVLAHVLLPLSATQASCHRSAPVLWWGVLGGIAVGYGLAIEIVAVVAVVGVGGWVGKTMHNHRHPPTQPSPAAPGPAPPLEPFLLFQMPLAVYVPSSTVPTPKGLGLFSQAEPPSPSNLRHPPIHLPDNLASCPICLVDFDPPTLAEQTNFWTGGEVVRPLRGCGHTFHPGCIDPWLTGTSARCPVCSKVVEVEGCEQTGREKQVWAGV